MNWDELKRAAAQAAVDQEVRSGMKVGLGSGSTFTYALDALGEALREGWLNDIIGVPSSEQIAQRARDHGIPLVELHEVGELDVSIDGADEIDPNLDLIKGLGGALLREKMIAQLTCRYVIIADESKLVPKLGVKAPLPVEVVPFGWQVHLPLMAELGAWAVRREEDGKPFVTDNGNYILDCHFNKETGIEDPAVLEWLLLARAGIVDHGLFLGMTSIAYVSGEEGVRTLEREAEGGEGAKELG
ncbi:MAG: ribose 5-phosphate isomerase A [Chloroflexota bacterium]|nr:ribose 5-phosphate isomerase A [Chloroflexota bacterium]